MMSSANNLTACKHLPVNHNVSIRVLDAKTGRVVQSHTGHNSATNSLLLGIGYYLNGEGVLNQGSGMLKNYLPQYISLGTMGLHGQNHDENGLPTDIGNAPSGATVQEQYEDYMFKRPGFGADGYDSSANNDRAYFGLGLPYTTFIANKTYPLGEVIIYNGNIYRCIHETTGLFDPADWEYIEDLNTQGFELISPTYDRSAISYRNVVPETYAERANTIDIVFSALISTGALAQFRNGHDYVFITEAGLWSKPTWTSGGENGLLAGYRIVPPDQSNWDMSIPENRTILQNNILRVGINQVVQVIWKIQLSDISPKSQEMIIHEVEEAVYATLLQQTWGN